MMKRLLCVSALLTVCALTASATGLRLGMTGAVKAKAQELDEKVVEHRRASGGPDGNGSLPQISNIQYTVGYTSAAISFQVNYIGQYDAKVEFGTSTAYGKSAYAIPGTPTMGLLFADKTYHFRIKCTAGGQTIYTPDQTLTTMAGSAVTFTHYIIDVDSVSLVDVMGWMNPPGHTFPTASQGFRVNNAAYPHPVHAPAAGVITGILYSPDNWETAVSIQFTPTMYMHIGHISTLDPAIVAAAGSLQEGEVWNNVSIPVSAGQIIGRMGNQSDSEIYLYNYAHETQFVAPEHQGFNMYADAMVPYYEQSKRDTLYTLVKGSPTVTNGKFDYDQPGKLVGNWFMDVSDPAKQPLAFAYDCNDPGTIIIAQAGGLTAAELYTVSGNAPDPATITEASGKVGFDLYQYTGGFGPGVHRGVLIAQLTAPNTLKVQFFPGSNNINEPFTANAITAAR